MLALAAAMRVVVVLRVGLGVEDVVGRIVLVLDELALAAQHLADDVEAAFQQHAAAFEDFLAGGAHRLEPFPAERRQRAGFPFHGFPAPSCSG